MEKEELTSKAKNDEVLRKKIFDLIEKESQKLKNQIAENVSCDKVITTSDFLWILQENYMSLKEIKESIKK